MSQKNLSLTNIDYDKISPQSIGKSIVISGNAKGGSKPYNYEFFINDTKVSSEGNSITWTPDKIGEYKIKVIVTDSNGAKVTTEDRYIIKEVSQNYTTVYYKKSSFSNVNIYYKIGSGLWTALPGIPMVESKLYDGFFETTIDLGDEEKLTACFNNGNNSWDNNDTKNYSLEPGSYKIENGVVSKLEDKLELKSFISDATDNITTGNEITLSAITLGGVGSINYKFYLEDGTILGEGNSNNIQWIPEKEGEYKIYVQAFDSKNNIVEGSITINVYKGIEIKEFSSDSTDIVKTGTVMNFNVFAEGGTGELNYKFILDNDVVLQDSNVSSLEWIPFIVGNHTISVIVYDNNNLCSKKDYDFNVYEELKSVELKASKEEKCNIGDTIKLSAAVTGGKEPFNYKFIINDNEELNDGSDSIVSWKPGEVGEYKIAVVVSDGERNEVVDSITYNVEEKKENIVKLYYKGYSNPNIHYKLGTGLWTAVPGVSMTKSEDMEGYYEITIDLDEEETMTACFNDGNGNWDNNSSKNYTFKSGVYTVYNKVVTDITDRPLEVGEFKTDVEDYQTIGEEIVLSAEGLYGLKEYEYKFAVISDNVETILSDFTNENTYTWKPDKTGEYQLRVYIKDGNGYVVSEDMLYTIKEVSKNIVTIYYNKYTNPYIHYKIGNGAWTAVPGILMKESLTMEGFYEITIDLGDEDTLTACFNNGNASWDNNSSKNYTFTSGKYKLVNRVITKVE